eukprot:8433109-Pyramimonas_sp.AAC.1
MPILVFGGGSHSASGLSPWRALLGAAGALCGGAIYFVIFMVRYLAERARPISLPRGRRGNPELPASPGEIAAAR